MASHLSYEESVSKVWKGLGLLALVTVIEVILSLAKAMESLEEYTWLIYLISFFIIVLSIYKAYYIIYEFMHLGYEVRTLAWTILLPLVLLVWALIAFINEGGYWRSTRENINLRPNYEVDSPTGMEIRDTDYEFKLS